MRHYAALLFLLLAASITTSTRINICIKNCSQCKQMFGHYFHGEACAASCLATKGRMLPDCNNPLTLRGLILRLY